MDGTCRNTNYDSGIAFEKPLMLQERLNTEPVQIERDGGQDTQTRRVILCPVIQQGDSMMVYKASPVQVERRNWEISCFGHH